MYPKTGFDTKFLNLCVCVCVCVCVCFLFYRSSFIFLDAIRDDTNFLKLTSVPSTSSSVSSILSVILVWYQIIFSRILVNKHEPRGYLCFVVTTSCMKEISLSPGVIANALCSLTEQAS